VLHGRESERARLAALLDRASHAHAGAIVIHGEAGVGKSALLDDLVAGAVDARVLRTQGLESESPLAFAALHRLLRPILPLLDRVAVPQARALRVAFGQEDGPAVDPFLIAVATLSVLTEAAEDRPVLAVVDDAHWLDDASANALLFAARRVQADRVALVFSARDGDRSGTTVFPRC
jgi:predicted ATPase